MTRSHKPAVVVVGSLHYDIMVDAPDRPRKGETVDRLCLASEIRRQGRQPGGRGGARPAPRFGWPAPSAMTISAASCLTQLAAGGVDASLRRRIAERRLGHERGDLRRRRRLWRGDRLGRQSRTSIRPRSPTPRSGWVRSALILQNEMPDSINVAAARAAQRRRGDGLPQRGALSRALGRLCGADRRPVVNAIEAEQFCGVPVDDLASAARAAETLSAGVSLRRSHGRG